MHAYIYRGDLYCLVCGGAIRAGILRDGPAAAAACLYDDSERFPQGPYFDGGGEADTPQHCRRCHVFLENPLTEDGYRYVEDALWEYAQCGRGVKPILRQWAECYDFAPPVRLARIGPVSEGTLRTSELLDALSDELVHLNGDEDLVSRAYDTSREYEKGAIDELTAGGVLDELMDALEECAPPYVYFGAQDGDGACFGFWPSLDALERDAEDGEIFKVEDLSEVPDDYEGLVMVVNDHGNVTLYRVKRGEVCELWGVV